MAHSLHCCHPSRPVLVGVINIATRAYLVRETLVGIIDPTHCCILRLPVQRTKPRLPRTRRLRRGHQSPIYSSFLLGFLDRPGSLLHSLASCPRTEPRLPRTTGSSVVNTPIQQSLSCQVTRSFGDHGVPRAQESFWPCRSKPSSPSMSAFWHSCPCGTSGS